MIPVKNRLVKILVRLVYQRELDSFLYVVPQWANKENSSKKLRLLFHLAFYFVFKTMQASLDPKIKTP